MPDTFKSATVTAQELAASNAGKIIADAPLISGKLHFIQGKVVVPASAGIGDTIEIVIAPSNVNVIPGLCSIQGPDQGTGAAVALGITGNTSAIAGATLLDGGAGVKLLNSNVGSFNIPTRQAILATISGAALTEGDTLYFNIACVVAE